MDKTKYLIMDVDGTLTDGKIYMSPSGEAMKAFSIKDGCGIHDLLPGAGIVPVIITARKSEIVVNRCRELGISEVYQGVGSKIGQMRSVVAELAQAAYIGDDINDLQCMQAVREAGRLVGCPADAVRQVMEIADFVAAHRGGDGAVRDFIEWILQQKR